MYKKYTLNINFFDNIETETQSYVLGYLYADGTHDPKKYTVRASANVQDIDIMYKVRNAVGSNKPVRINRHNMCEIEISQKYFDYYRYGAEEFLG